MRSWVLAAAALSTLGSTGAPPTQKIIRIERPIDEVYVSGGTFQMGITDEQRDELDAECAAAHPLVLGQLQQQIVHFCDEHHHTLEHMAARDVYVDAFFMDRHEVSVAAYRKCIAAGGCALDPLVAGDPRYVEAGWPLVNVTWGEARAYCAWKGGRLPTEAEWERAAKGTEGRVWPWGPVARAQDWNHGQARNAAMRAIDRTPNEIDLMGELDDSDGAALLATPGTYVWGEAMGGIADLSGNVAEWTADAWVNTTRAAGYQTAIKNSDIAAPEGWEFLPSINPVREGDLGDARVVRGGSWRQPMYLGKSFARDPYNMLYLPNRRFSHVGFRCVRAAR